MQYKAIDSNTGEIKLYGRVSEWWNSAEDFTATLAEMEQKFSTVRVRIHCFGGSVFEGSVIFNALQSSKANIEIYIDGVAASMASIIMLAGKKIIMAENAFVMIHAPSGYTEGNSAAHQNTAKLLQSMEKNFARAYAKKSGKSEKEVGKWLDGNDYWFSAEEAKEAGLIDEVVQPVVSSIVAFDTPTEQGVVETVFGRYAALLQPTATQKPVDIKMKQILIAMFGLAAVGINESSTDQQVADAVKKQIDDLKAAVNAQAKAHIESMIANAEKAAGKPFVAKARETLVSLGEKAGLDALELSLSFNKPVASSPAVPNLVNMLDGKAAGADATRAAWSWKEWQEKDPRGLEKMEKENKDAFKALYKSEYGVEPEL